MTLESAQQLNGTPARFIDWPGWSTFKYNSLLSFVFFLVFSIIYGTTDYLTRLHNHRVEIHFPWEPSIPFIPEMAIVYVSLTPLLLLAPFIIRDIAEFKILFKVMVCETVVAAIFFLLLPVQEGFPSQQVDGWIAPVFDAADTINLTYNELPSLHVAFAFTAALVFARRAQQSLQIVLFAWATLLAISTLLTHQHHLLGTLAGAILAWAAVGIVGRSISILQDRSQNEVSAT